MKFKNLKFSVMEPGDPDVGDPGFENEVTILFKKDVNMDPKGFKEFIKNTEKLLDSYFLDTDYGSVERVK